MSRINHVSVHAVDTENSLLLIKGALPGARGSVVALDSSETMLEQARTNLGHGPRVEFVRADLGVRPLDLNGDAIADLTQSYVPAANEKAYDGASVDCTPTISVVSPSRSRARMQPQIPDPCPIGT